MENNNSLVTGHKAKEVDRFPEKKNPQNEIKKLRRYKKQRFNEVQMVYDMNEKDIYIYGERGRERERNLKKELRAGAEK